jgi:polyhydroxyalkanoate synthesis regulator phasin
MLRTLRYGGIIVAVIALMGVLAWNIMPQTQAAAAAQTEEPSDLSPDAADQPETFRLRGPGHHHDARDQQPAGALIRTTAELTGLEPSAVMEALRNGQSLAQIAAANGQSGEAVVQAVVDKATERLDQLVANGRIAQEEADQMITRLTERANTLVNDTELGQKIEQRRDQHQDRIVQGALVQTTSELTGLSKADIMERLRNGESLAEIAAAEGQSSAAVVDAAVDNFRTAAEEAINATP